MNDVNYRMGAWIGRLLSPLYPALKRASPVLGNRYFWIGGIVLAVGVAWLTNPDFRQLSIQVAAVAGFIVALCLIGYYGDKVSPGQREAIRNAFVILAKIIFWMMVICTLGLALMVKPKRWESRYRDWGN